MDNSSNRWPAHPCPNCGYCPCCGRANSAPRPLFVPVPVYPAPYSPVYPTTTPWYPPIVWMGSGTAPAVSAGTVANVTSVVVGPDTVPTLTS